MLPDRVSNPGPLTYELGALPIALRGPAKSKETDKKKINESLPMMVSEADIFHLFKSFYVKACPIYNCMHFASPRAKILFKAQNNTETCKLLCDKSKKDSNEESIKLYR